MMKRARSPFAVLVAALTLGCSAGGTSHSLLVGNEETGGASSGTGGNDATNPILAGDAGSATALGAHIEQDHVTIELVTLGCAGDCADVEAVARGGYPPYTFAWEDGSTNPVRHVCPSSSTAYQVSVTDTGFASGEFKQEPETVQAPLTAKVLACADGGAKGTDGGGGICADGPMLEPGHYVGTLTCPSSTSSGGAAGSTGTLSLDLAVDGSGTLFFQWSLIVIGAQGTLHAAPDCSAGEFRATWEGAWGVPGPADPNNPNNPPPLLPTGTITGDLTMAPVPGTPDTISGNFHWDAPPVANQPASICVGNFTAERKP